MKFMQGMKCLQFRRRGREQKNTPRGSQRAIPQSGEDMPEHGDNPDDKATLRNLGNSQPEQPMAPNDDLSKRSPDLCLPSNPSPTPHKPVYIRHELSNPPPYHAYRPPATSPQPEFPNKATALALRASKAPESPHTVDIDRIEAVNEQYQLLSSIRYGDQLNRGLDELKRFQEDWRKEVGEKSGLTEEEMERRSRIIFYGGRLKERAGDDEELGVT